jgi:Fe2+ transport system protein FeoA
MGLTPGRVVRCIRKNGPNVVCLRLEGQDTEIFINRMMAERIGVEPIDAEAEEKQEEY